MTFADRLLLPAVRRTPTPLQEIYAAVRRRARRHQIRLTRHWRATVRNTLQRNCLRHPKCQGRPRFVHLRRGLWRRK